MTILSQVLLGFAAIALLIFFRPAHLHTAPAPATAARLDLALCRARVSAMGGSTPICVLWGAVSVRLACAVLLAASAGRMVAGDAEGSIGRTANLG